MRRSLLVAKVARSVRSRLGAGLTSLAFLCALTGCNGSQPHGQAGAGPSPAKAPGYPPRPTVPPPAVKLFHQDNDTLTLTTKPDATDDEISAILWQFRDAARDHHFAALHLPQAFIDARKPVVWFHLYRGAKCAGEKYTKGPLPCEASYHGAGDFTFGDYKNPLWDDGVLRHGANRETRLWDPDAPYTDVQP